MKNSDLTTQPNQREIVIDRLKCFCCLENINFHQESSLEIILPAVSLTSKPLNTKYTVRSLLRIIYGKLWKGNIIKVKNKREHYETKINITSLYLSINL